MPRPRGRPVKGEGDDAKERILQAATKLFAERGFAATSVAAICERADVGKPALYWHFGSKDDLLSAALEELSVRWIEEVKAQAAIQGTPIERLEKLTEGWRRILHEQPEHLRLPMVAQLEQAGGSEIARAAIRKAWKRGEDAMAQGIRDALGTDLPDLDLVAHTAVTLLQGALMRYNVDPDEKQLDRMLFELRRTVSLLIWIRLPMPARRAVAERFAAEQDERAEGDPPQPDSADEHLDS